MKKSLLTGILLYVSFLYFNCHAFSQIPPGYYDSANGLTGIALKNKLHDIISGGFVSLTYSSLLVHFQTTDVRQDGKVWDMYSDIPGGTPPYLFSFSMSCGSYTGEGDCYNREHSVPQSWFGGLSPMYSDLFHIVPTDGWVNNKRSNYPFGEVASSTWTSLNGSKLGTSAVQGYAGTVFEPVDSFKGDFARIYFYMATRYKDEIPGWVSDVFTGSDFTVWAKNLFLAWDSLDPVSIKEINRNNNVYQLQNNRNPYVDHPEWVDEIWGNPSAVFQEPEMCSYSVSLNMENNINIMRNCLFPLDNVFVNLLSYEGRIILSEKLKSEFKIIETGNLKNGIYFLRLSDDRGSHTFKLAIIR